MGILPNTYEKPGIWFWKKSGDRGGIPDLVMEFRVKWPKIDEFFTGQKFQLCKWRTNERHLRNYYLQIRRF